MMTREVQMAAETQQSSWYLDKRKESQLEKDKQTKYSQDRKHDRERRKNGESQEGEHEGLDEEGSGAYVLQV